MKAIFVLCLFLSLSVMAQTDFIPGTDDLPMMDKMVVDENESMSFDTPDGQILTLMVVTPSSRQEILHFYDTNLGALGWNKTSTGHYKRDKDVLIIQTQKHPDGTLAIFQVTTPNN